MLLPSGFHSHGEAIAKHLRPSQVKGLALWVGGTILAHSNCQNAVLGVSEVYRDLAIPVAPQYCGRLSRRRSLRGAVAALRRTGRCNLPNEAYAERRRCGVPEAATFRTKPQLALGPVDTRLWLEQPSTVVPRTRPRARVCRIRHPACGGLPGPDVGFVLRRRAWVTMRSAAGRAGTAT